MLKYCKETKRSPYFDEFHCIAIDKDPDNYRNLEEVVSRDSTKPVFDKNIKIHLINDEFANVVEDILNKVGGRIAPSFVFIDPFGFKGIPFKTVKSILSCQKTEIFFTFMTRDINRFLNIPQVESILDELFPIPEWRRIIKLRDWQARDRALKDLYIKCLQEEAGVKYVWAFRVCMDEKYQTLYYLIHATNHFDGLKIMKDIMHKQGASGEFAWLGPNESSYKSHLQLFEEDLSSLKKYLCEQFKNTTKTFREIIEETYMHTRFVEKDYRKAVIELEKDKEVKIKDEGPRGGIKDATKITF